MQRPSSGTSPASSSWAGLFPARLAERLGGPGDAEARFTGAALVIDVAGYTPLTETLTAAGADGPERVSRLIDRLFSHFIDVIEGTGGEVVHFAGDALVAYFVGADLAAAAIAGERCARQVLSLDRHALAGENHPVAVHAGLAAGRLWAARIGRFADEHDLLFGGPALRAAYRATRRAGAGALVVDDDTRRWLAPSRVTTATGEPPARAGAGAPAGLVAPLVLDRLTSAGSFWSAELRTVSCLFVRIGGLDEDAPEALTRARDVILILDRTLASAGPTFAPGRLVIDDHGLTFIWVAGAPLGASVVDADHNLGMAARLAAALGAAGFPCSAGFASGRAFCGLIGTEKRREMVTVGRPMNLAARLMDLDDGVLSAEPPLRQRLHQVALEPLPPRALKGFARPVALARVRPAQPNGDTPLLVGRDAQQAALTALLARPRHGRPTLCVIAADAGMGKSTLLGACLSRARGAGHTVLQGAAQSAARTSAYFAWRPIFGALYEAHQRAHGAAASPRTWLAATGSDPELAPLLNAILPLAQPDSALTAPLEGRRRADATNELLIRLLRAAGPALTLALEDVHFMDSVSLGFIDELAHADVPVLLIVTGRPGAAIERLAGRLADVDLLQLSLTPLAKNELAALLQARIQATALDGRVVDKIHTVTAGNPLFAQEYLYLLRESGKLRDEAGHVSWAGATAADLPVPDTVLSAVSSRIDGLSSQDQLVVKTASVFGDSFNEAALADVHPAALDDGSLSACLQRLLDDHLIERDGAPGQYRFRHGEIQLAAYNLLLFEQRAALHEQIGRTLERCPADELDRHRGLLVHHFAAAQDWPRALPHAARAADLALRQGAYHEAQGFLSLCLQRERDAGVQAGEPLARRVSWYRKLGEAAAGTGDLRLRREAAEQALRAAGHAPRPLALLGPLVAGMRLLGRTRAHIDLPAARAADPRGPWWRDLAQCHRHLAVVAYFSNQPVRVAHHATLALKYAQRAGASPELAGALAELGTCLGLAGADAAGCRHLEAAGRTALAISDRPSLAYTDMVACLYLVGAGRWPEVERHADRCQQLCETLQDHVNWANAQVVRFWMHFYKGDLAIAAQAALRLHARATQARNQQQQAWGSRCLALCALEDDQLDAAEQHIQAALDLVETGDDHNERVPLWCALADLRTRQQRWPEAEALCGLALAALGGQSRLMGHAVLEGISALVSVTLRLATAEGNADRANRRRVGNALTALRRYVASFPIGQARLWYWQGHWAAVRGRHAQATTLWQQALTEARTRGMARDQTLVETALGGSSPRSGAKTLRSA